MNNNICKGLVLAFAIVLATAASAQVVETTTYDD